MKNQFMQDLRKTSLGLLVIKNGFVLVSAFGEVKGNLLGAKAELLLRVVAKEGCEVDSRRFCSVWRWKPNRCAG